MRQLANIAVMVGIMVLMLLTTSCASLSSPEFKTVAAQNRQNVEALNKNTILTLALCRKNFESNVSNSLRLAAALSRNDIWTAAVAQGPPNAALQWVQLPIITRWQWAEIHEACAAESLTDARRTDLVMRHGWLLYAYEHQGEFTPFAAHNLVLQYDRLDKQDMDPDKRLEQQLALLIPYDARLAYYVETSKKAGQFIDQLAEELLAQLNILDSQSQSLVKVSEMKTDWIKVCDGILESDGFNEIVNDCLERKETKQQKHEKDIARRQQIRSDAINILRGFLPQTAVQPK